MTENQHKALTVYKASAGSGKTFTLATQYISLVIENPQAYRNILAVTFTNKATEEMKMRILSQLYGIANSLESSNGYLAKVKENTGLGDKMIRERAGIALSNLLHNFNYFRVETIDAFFQTVLRNLARELDLTANMRINLNDRQIMEEAVDELIESLDAGDKVLLWIMDYIHEKMDDDKGWNVIGQIKSFGQNIFKDEYKAHSDQLEPLMKDDDFFKSFSAQMRKTVKETRDKMRQIGETFFEILEGSGYSEDDLKGKTKGIGSYFRRLIRGEFTDEEKLINVTTQKCIDSPDNWLTKTQIKSNPDLYELVSDQLWQLLKDSETIRPKLIRAYKSAGMTIRHLNQLRLLDSIGQRVRLNNEEANRFLLSDTQTLLHSLIEDSDSPFIFEKTGTQLDHIMIDEFQDTSTIQWQNFRILLGETMSRAKEDSSISQNLIVGDVKQSIYRWRSGDWRLLNGIEQQFAGGTVDPESLTTNYRSERNIINFNNVFFETARELEYNALCEYDKEKAGELKKAYADVRQEIPEKRGNGGLVEIELLPNDKDYHDAMLEKTADTLQMLLEANVKPKDIAIMVRNNDTIQEIGDYLTGILPDTVNLVSDVAFRLDASSAVAIIINALHLLTHEDDNLAKANLVKLYQTQIAGTDKKESDILRMGISLDKQLPEAYIAHFEELKSMPLMDLVEKIYGVFSLSKLDGQSAYICAFYDALSDYLTDKTPDIDSFLAEWDNSIGSKTIQSDEIDGVRLITIHKSKGLEFDNVIMPFTDWKLEKRSTLWCSPEEEPYSKLPLIPVDLDKSGMMGSVYEKDYIDEHLQNTVDNLNLLYVAFTRAGKNLFVYGKHSNNAGYRDVIIENALKEVSRKLNDGNSSDTTAILHGIDDDKTEPVTFEYGHLTESHDDRKNNNDNVFEEEAGTLKIKIENFDNKITFRQSNDSEDFIEQEDEEAVKTQTYIHTGNVLHQIFSTIHTTADIENALKQLEQDGVLYDKDLKAEDLKDKLRRHLANPQVQDWFSDRWQLFNECSILHVDKDTGKVKEHRPDRVMTDGEEMIVVDFKFGNRKAKHFDQVGEYIKLLKDMGYTNVTGYLWYVRDDEIVKVNQ